MTQPGGTYLTDRSTGTLHAAAALSAVAALIHLLAAPEHFEEWWGYGTFFLVSALAQAAFGAALLRDPRRILLPLGITGNLAIIGLYLLTRTAGIPSFRPYAGEVEGVGPLDLVATASEAALVAALVVLHRGRGLSREGWAMVALGVGLALTFLGYAIDPGPHG